MAAIFKLSKSEILRGKTTVDRLFSEGESFVVYPYRAIYLFQEAGKKESGFSILFSVSKKRFKRAVKRNLIRRKMKEALRLNCKELDRCLCEKGIHLDMAILFLDKTIPDYSVLERKMCDLLDRMQKQIVRNLQMEGEIKEADK